MFDKFKKVAGEVKKAGAKFVQENPEKIGELLKKGSDLISENSILENARDNSVNIIQEALNTISPIKIDLDSSLTEKSIVIDEEALNNYLKEKASDIEWLEDINLKIEEDNQLLISGEATKSLLKISFSQKLKLKKIVLNKEEGFAEFELSGDPDINATGFINKIILFIVRLILKSVINRNLIETMNENSIQIEGSKLFVDLKNGFAKQFYEKNINEIIERDIPLIGEKKIIEILKIREVTTKKKKILVSLGLGR